MIVLIIVLMGILSTVTLAEEKVQYGSSISSSSGYERFYLHCNELKNDNCVEFEIMSESHSGVGSWGSFKARDTKSLNKRFKKTSRANHRGVFADDAAGATSVTVMFCSVNIVSCISVPFGLAIDLVTLPYDIAKNSVIAARNIFKRNRFLKILKDMQDPTKSSKNIVLNGDDYGAIYYSLLSNY